MLATDPLGVRLSREAEAGQSVFFERGLDSIAGRASPVSIPPRQKRLVLRHGQGAAVIAMACFSLKLQFRINRLALSPGSMVR